MLIVSDFWNQGVPQVGLSPTITIYDVSDGSVLINAEVMTEIASGAYKYEFAAYDNSKNYYIVCDGGNTLPLYDRYTHSFSSIEGIITNISNDIANIPGSGAIEFSYTLTNTINGLPIADAEIWITTDESGINTIAFGRTNEYGIVTFHLDAGTIYVWRKKSGFMFDNPDVEIVS